MCIIVDNWEGRQCLEMDILRNCWENNDDGAGIAYLSKDRIVVKKGIMTWETFEKVYSEAKGFPHVIHFRIGTSGSDPLGCTHPFPITKSIPALSATSYTTNGIVVAHNGVLGSGQGSLSDTQVFVRDFLYPLYKVMGDRILSGNKYLNSLIENRIVGSRIILIHPKHGTQRFGKGWIQENGVWFSNSSYKTSFLKINLAYRNFKECSLCEEWFEESEFKDYGIPKEFPNVCPSCHLKMMEGK